MNFMLGITVCKNCEHAGPSEIFKTMRECHFGPPNTMLVVQPGPGGQPVVAGHVTTPPIVSPEGHCHQFKRRIERAASLPIDSPAFARG